MKLLFVGNFNITRGTGYATILANLCTALADHGHILTVLALHWDRSEHRFPFQVIPGDYFWIPMQVLRLHQALEFEHVILAMDVPKIEQLLREVELQIIDWPPVSALFPVESGPLVGPWIKGLSQLRQRFVISCFGQRELERVGLDSIFVPMTACPPARNVPKPEARRALRKKVVWGNQGLLDGMGPLALTVADNQERKDLPVIAQALATLRGDGVKMAWLLVTSFGSPYGWHLPTMLSRTGMAKQTVVLEALTARELSCAYYAADLFVLASQAEGACLPLYEALAHDLPCVAPDHTAITEALADGRGTLVPHNGSYIHPWGCVNRYPVRPAALAAALNAAAHPGDERLVEFIAGRTWDQAAHILEVGLDEQKAKRTPHRTTPAGQENGAADQGITAGDGRRGSAADGTNPPGALFRGGAGGPAGRIRIRGGPIDPLFTPLQGKDGR